MTLEQKIANSFQMSDEVWERHTNPWSVWTRLTVLPLIILGVWSRIWLGWWSILIVMIALIWNWLNPRCFPVPKNTNNWASQAVLGERIWLNRDQSNIPSHHQLAPLILSGMAALGIIFVVFGLVKLAVYPTLMGAILVYTGKLWFLDRMVWLYQDFEE
ncbi:DUF6653 family protein [Cyanothece sp. BG0011]|uniref:DUF6653 family protein n=1 Tax=Cyanothece sp. BG0011 TaxID=2082950 RepID=UPI000D1FCDF7|nr:DUF6653 family protein [Cyanothece sp. BG0011]